MIIDTHCHLYLKDFGNDKDLIISKAVAAGVERFYLPGIDSSVVKDMLELEQQYKDKCFAMIGLHPCSVKDDVVIELQNVYDWLVKRPFAAVGEIGLDFYHDTTFKEQQYQAFHQQIIWALEFKHPIVIHSRNAMRETVDVINQYRNTALKGIFHCFSGNEAEALEIIAAGFYLGIGGVLTYKNSGLDKAIEKIDLSHLVLETDAPYLTPVPYRGKRNESSYLTYIVEKLADIKGVTTQEVAAITTANAKKIFGN